MRPWSIGPVPVDQRFANYIDKIPDVAPRPILRRRKLGLKTFVNPLSETYETIAIQSAKSSNQVSTGIKPVRCRKCGCWDCLVVVKPGVPRREAGRGTFEIRQIKQAKDMNQCTIHPVRNNVPLYQSMYYPPCRCKTTRQKKSINPDIHRAGVNSLTSI